MSIDFIMFVVALFAAAPPLSAVLTKVTRELQQPYPKTHYTGSLYKQR